MKHQNSGRRWHQRLSCVGIILLGFISSAPSLQAESCGGAKEGDKLSLTLGMARLYKLQAPASQIVVGNPDSIAVALIDPSCVLLTPRDRGVGNVLFLDDEKNVFKSLLVSVGMSPVISHDVTVYRALSRAGYECNRFACVQTSGAPSGTGKVAPSATATAAPSATK